MAASPLPPARGACGPPVLGFVACGTVVRRSAFLAVGGFPRRFGIGGEEQMLAVDLASAGWELAYRDDIVAHHWPAPQAANRERRSSAEIRNALWSAWLRRRPRTALRLTGSIALGALREGQGRAIGEAAAGLPWALRHRRRLPAEVEHDLERLA
jgi:GT2 family glycosyltransferase